MTESLMTETAATTTEGAASSQDAANAQAQGQPTAGESTATQQQATEGQNQDGSTEGTDPVKTDAEEGKPEGAPEKYEFKAPENKSFDPELLNAYSEVAKELNLSQDAAQKMLSTLAPAIEARQMQQIEAVRAEWAESSRTDKEFGGDGLDQNLAVAKKALDQFGSPELRTLLNESGLGNNPEVIRFMFRAGKAISEDRFVGRSEGGVKAGPRTFGDQASALYSNQP